MKSIKLYASLVKFSHTVFAMPFALILFFYASKIEGHPMSVLLLAEVLLCMLFARNAAMAFNRYADRRFDALNPRTAGREIPSGKIAPRNAVFFIIINALLFIATAAAINKLAFILSPIALVIILGYSLTKRFSPFCHIFLGLALAIAPLGAYIAVTGTIGFVSLMFSALVLAWVSGFDIIYALQDAEFDRNNGLKSIPASIGVGPALAVSAMLHLISIAAVIVIASLYPSGLLYKIGGAIFVGLLIYQHIIVTPGKLSRIGTAFGTLNGIASVCFAAFTIADFYFPL